ncbi:hypothetical protein BH18ACI5_BH18ACI5_09000 [soil metagenome]
MTLLVVMAPVAYTTATCAGWSGSAAERMACCTREGASRASASADDCCAGGEQRKNSETVATVLVTPGLQLAHPVPVVTRRPPSVIDSPPSLSDRPDTYLLDSAFLI